MNFSRFTADRILIIIIPAKIEIPSKFNAFYAQGPKFANRDIIAEKLSDEKNIVFTLLHNLCLNYAVVSKMREFEVSQSQVAVAA